MLFTETTWKEVSVLALINCPECNKEISDSCVSCPNCGYTLKNSKYKVNIQSLVNKLVDRTKIKPKLLITGFICIILIVLLLVSFGGSLFLSPSVRYSLKAVQKIQDGLLMPESIRIYDIYYEKMTSDPDYEAEDDPLVAQVYVYYGATNKGGGTTDNDCCVVFRKSGYIGIDDSDASIGEFYHDAAVLQSQEQVQDIMTYGKKISEEKIQKMIN